MTRARSLLDDLEQAERAATGPPPEVADRMWATIEQRMVQGPPPPAELDLPTTTPAPARLVLKIVGGVTLVGLAAGLLAAGLSSDPEPVASVEPMASVEPAPIVAPEPALEPTQAILVAPAPIVEPEPAPVIEAPTDKLDKLEKPSGAKPVVQKSLAEELVLMQAMSTALADGDSKQVLELVAEHRRDFPHGQFIEERSASEARAMCRTGKPKAKTKAEQFAARWPSSIHLAAVQHDCGD